MSTKKFKCTSCKSTSEKIGVLSYARQTLNVATGDYTNTEIEDTVHGFCLDCATIIPAKQLKRLSGLTAEERPNYQKALTLLVNSAETEGCDGCATVSLEDLNQARKILGFKSL